MDVAWAGPLLGARRFRVLVFSINGDDQEQPC